LLVLGAALAAGVGVVLLSPDYVPLYDAADYVRHAVSIGNGHGFPDSVLTTVESPSAFRPPLYPYLLGGIYAVFGEVETAARLVGALLGAAAVGLVYLIARAVWSERTALAAAAVAAVFPGLVLLNQALISEPLFLVAELAAVLFALWSRAAGGSLRWAAAAGLCCGLAALTRSNGILIVIPIAAGVWVARPRFSRRGLAAPVLAIAVALLTVVPWAVRNSLVFDRVTGFNAQTGYGLAGTYNEDAYEEEGHRAGWIPPRLTERYKPLYERTDLDEVELDSELREEAVSYAFDNPRYTVEATGLNALRMFELAGAPPTGFGANRAQMAQSEAEARVDQISLYVLALIAAAGFVLMARMPRERRLPLFAWAVPVLITVVVFPIIGSTRYRTVIYPFLAIAAAPALVATADRLRARVGTAA
jgi:4-amino-4-deoxy-L-arabinose transferase-like glycosyltransferase